MLTRMWLMRITQKFLFRVCAQKKMFWVYAQWWWWWWQRRRWKIIKITAVFNFLALHFSFGLNYIHYIHEQARHRDGWMKLSRTYLRKSGSKRNWREPVQHNCKPMHNNKHSSLRFIAQHKRDACYCCEAYTHTHNNSTIDFSSENSAAFFSEEFNEPCTWIWMDACRERYFLTHI